MLTSAIPVAIQIAQSQRNSETVHQPPSSRPYLVQSRRSHKYKPASRSEVTGGQNAWSAQRCPQLRCCSKEVTGRQYPWFAQHCPQLHCGRNEITDQAARSGRIMARISIWMVYQVVPYTVWYWIVLYVGLWHFSGNTRCVLGMNGVGGQLRNRRGK